MNKKQYFRPLRFIALLIIAVTVSLGYYRVSAGITVSPPARLTANPFSSPVLKKPFPFPEKLMARVSTAKQSYSEFEKVSDASETITLFIPSEWSDIETGAWKYHGKQAGVFLTASSDLDGFSKRSEPGVFIGVSHILAHENNGQGLLSAEKKELSGQCTDGGRFDYKDPFYTGQYDLYTKCRNGGHNQLVLTTMSADHELLILVRVNVLSEADLQAATRIFETFQVLGNPEEDSHHDH